MTQNSTLYMVSNFLCVLWGYVSMFFSEIGPFGPLNNCILTDSVAFGAEERKGAVMITFCMLSIQSASSGEC